MPELPEVESLRRILARSVTGRTIVGAEVSEARLRRRVSPSFGRQVAHRKILGLNRRAKYLVMEFDTELRMLIHLGMSGSLTHRDKDFANNSLDGRHDHVRFFLDDDTTLVYNDPRRFGLLKLIRGENLDSVAELKGLGPEPLSRDFNAEYLARKARGRKLAIKNFLMNQRIVAGIGNIYASELLFRSGVRPTRRAGRVSRSEFEKIVAATQAVLREAIDSRGTTFRSYLDSRGEPGAFSSRLSVYGREGKPCFICSTPIRNLRLGQSSFFCRKCQR